MLEHHPTDCSESLASHYIACRDYSLFLCDPLSDEDLQAQSMPDASPLKWHLAHTSWAFETFLLKPHLENYRVFNPQYEYLFNSYYNAIGAQFPRPQRGLLTRPGRDEILDYRKHVDKAMQQLLMQMELQPSTNASCQALVWLLINHEQQHQELMLTDLKHLLSINPTYPIYRHVEELLHADSVDCSETWIEFAAGLYPIGHQQEVFYFDNEGPQHQAYLEAFSLSSQLVSNRDYLAFIDSGGYQAAEFWLSEAWQVINAEQCRHPLYWILHQGEWHEYTLGGLKPLVLDEPVKHINYFEANAFANWKGKRLPTEQEWETAARAQPQSLKQVYNQLWQWTSSSYCAYPGFKTADGAIGEYNGKFMVNQYVLRGGSIATPREHIRPSYRNFFYPGASWQFSGIRLAETI